MSETTRTTSAFDCFRKYMSVPPADHVRPVLIDAINALWQHQVVAFYGNWYFDYRRDLPFISNRAEYGVDELRNLLLALGSAPNPFAEEDGYSPAFLRALGLYVPATDSTTGMTLANLATEGFAVWDTVPAGVKALAVLNSSLAHAS